MTVQCTHGKFALVTTTHKDYCEECVRIGAQWVHLRLCMTCGHAGCCESSAHRHATAHAKAANHPLVRSIEPGESWIWCYEDQAIVGDASGWPHERRHSGRSALVLFRRCEFFSFHHFKYRFNITMAILRIPLRARYARWRWTFHAARALTGQWLHDRIPIERLK
jgi:Zn-finger in ubiquitin-hydrolases and other protein